MSELKAGPAGVPFFQRHRPTRVMRYGAAVALVILALALRWLIFGHLDNRLPFAFFLVAVMVAAWYGGLGPGMLAAAAGLLLGDYFFLPEHGAYAALGPPERTVITVYAINAALIVVLMENLHTRIRWLEWMLQDRGAGERSDPR